MPRGSNSKQETQPQLIMRAIERRWGSISENNAEKRRMEAFNELCDSMTEEELATSKIDPNWTPAGWMINHDGWNM
jgi:hypothetical protein